MSKTDETVTVHLTVTQFIALRGDVRSVNIYAWGEHWSAKLIGRPQVEGMAHFTATRGIRMGGASDGVPPRTYIVAGSRKAMEELLEHAKNERGWRTSRLSSAIAHVVRKIEAALKETR